MEQTDRLTDEQTKRQGSTLAFSGDTEGLRRGKETTKRFNRYKEIHSTALTAVESHTQPCTALQPHSALANNGWT